MQAELTTAKPLLSGNPSENQDQPSPISVLETPFLEDDLTATEASGNHKPLQHGTLYGNHLLSSPFISLPISW